jgi:hypothetical protein
LVASEHSGRTARAIAGESLSFLGDFEKVAVRWQNWTPMCRNIRPLFNFAPPATEEEIRAAAIQYVRKVSGVQKPSQSNLAEFDRAVLAVTDATRQLVQTLVTTAPPRDRDEEREKARVRNIRRFGPSDSRR